MARIKNYKYLIKIDIILVFNRIWINFKHKNATLFITSFGMYCYRVMFFGLMNGLATWQNYINDVLFEYLNVFCQAYINDILIYSKTRKEHY